MRIEYFAFPCCSWHSANGASAGQQGALVLLLHYAFDLWMGKMFPGVPFERHADDAICHCRGEKEALALREALDRRFAECRLALHREKTKIVYCKDTNRKREYPSIHFELLGYRFGQESAKWRDGLKRFRQRPNAARDWRARVLRLSPDEFVAISSLVSGTVGGSAKDEDRNPRPERFC